MSRKTPPAFNQSVDVVKKTIECVEIDANVAAKPRFVVPILVISVL